MTRAEAEARLARSAPSDVTCPTCGVAPGFACRKARQPDQPHQARLDALAEHRAELRKLIAWQTGLD